MTYQLTTLPNGLRIASETLPGVESVAVSVSVDVGARYEDEAENGVAHLLEHMAFKGTKKRSAKDIAEEFDNIGGHFNAYTSLEHTVYYAKVLKGNLPLALDILSDILLHSCFDAEELKREQGVVCQEIAMHRDSPDDLIFDIFDACAFPDQPLGRSILGTPEKLCSYTRDNLLSYMRKHYQPARMVISAAGNLSHEALVALAECYFTLPAGTSGSSPQQGVYVGGESRVPEDLEQLQLIIGFPALSVHHEDFYALQLYSGILGGGMSSRLFQEIREKRGMAYHVSSMVAGYNDCGVLSLYSATGAEQARELPLLLMDELKRMTDGVSGVELDRARNQQKAELLMARESPGTVAGWIGKHLLRFGRYKNLEEIVARIETVTKDDVHRMAEMIAGATKPTVTALGLVDGLPAYESITARLSG